MTLLVNILNLVTYRLEFALSKFWKSMPFILKWLLKVMSMLFIFGAAMLSSVLLKHEAQLNDNKDPWIGALTRPFLSVTQYVIIYIYYIYTLVPTHVKL